MTAKVTAGQAGDDPAVPTLTELLAHRARDSPEREFLRFGEWSWSFAEIDDWTSRLAHRLIEADGVGQGDRVAIMLPNVVHWPVVWLAALKAGAVTVPVNSSYRRADLAFVLRDSGARVVFTDADRVELIAGVIAGEDELAGVRVVDVADDGSEPFPVAPPAVPIDGGTLANLQYTSGTTGFPKACMLTHDYWVRLGWICASATGLGPEDVLLTAQPFSYMDPQWNTALALTVGAPLVVVPRFSASTFMADVRRHRATFFYVLGSMPTLLFKQPPTPEDRDNDLRLVFCSGIPVGLHARLEERWGAPWREIYGMTESGIDLFSPFGDTDAVGSGNLGRPVPTKQVRVVDPCGTEVPDGEAGELVVAGTPMMNGYWNRPEDTARVLRDGWLHTGDVVVRRPDGGIRLVGRIKDMVRRGGENVASVEVEAALERDDLVVSAAVVAEPDETLGEEVKAFVQLAAGVPSCRATAERIVERAGKELARFKVPRYVEFVADFPRTPSERVSKPALKARAADDPGVTYDLGARRGFLGVDLVRDVAVLTLRRPGRLNALDVATRLRLAAAIREFGTGERVRGIVLTGEGRAFSAGMDLQSAPSTDAEMREAFASFHDLTRAILETRVPVVAAVNGIAVGGASELTLCCDARIGTPEAEYYQPENGRGITISNASSVLLRRLVGNHAMRVVLGSPRIRADEALRVGLLDEIVEPGALIGRAVDTVIEWTPEGNTTALHLALLRPRAEDVEAAFAREDLAAAQAWESGVLTAGIEGFLSTRDTAGAEKETST
ncbi:AMP-binding protein [Amycolatopsis regifaucium]|uniref:AMP-dependent synthetase n=1 Tax=Amycolatopsis regifaucium TaxID=546365 RepID=A0A154M3U3_9PSEU|nr:AMP-binding protein [Amycolatopsis regifaucium]KZB79272.1 AMP-dependent synthetase [Amycolatopsis regifaucium]OKA07454.1 AMP-dependent synthetase [Amycolatopsis regifaucium]SFH11079.1 Acyl-CoA synthetase (AMP-forming)/AMP-acid ligase II [Amycolatopsis regifaucium]